MLLLIYIKLFLNIFGGIKMTTITFSNISRNFGSLALDAQRAQYFMDKLEVVSDLSGYYFLARPLASITHLTLGFWQLATVFCTVSYVGGKKTFQGTKNLGLLDFKVCQKVKSYGEKFFALGAETNVKSETSWEEVNMGRLFLRGVENCTRGYLEAVVPMVIFELGAFAYDTGSRYRKECIIAVEFGFSALMICKQWLDACERFFDGFWAGEVELRVVIDERGDLDTREEPQAQSHQSDSSSPRA